MPPSPCRSENAIYLRVLAGRRHMENNAPDFCAMRAEMCDTPRAGSNGPRLYRYMGTGMHGASPRRSASIVHRDFGTCAHCPTTGRGRA
ncbi:hypothetical protein FRACA_1000014 [Frankia canadensis]|uniref:Uncharacterized protein n=1 Tax=Frankia canadensis TaxID=1836972 RepID=A0A2I2KIN6_9ACTN|nr:hypothetical protein FRACA_1000014 [Frankia canadensis]SOU52804.1 hypothetical protein FRACA_1000014 [Frankia canadensis]